MQIRHQKPRKPFFGSIRGIAFDLDDTLFSRSSALESFLKSLKTKDLRKIISKDQGGYGNRDEFFSWLAGNLQLSMDGPELHRKFIAEFSKHIPLQKKNRVILEELRNRGYRLALLSNGGSTLQRSKLKATGLFDQFESERILISGEIEGDKPNGIVFRKLADRMELPPSEILYVGDHLENDVHGSREAGLNAAWLKNHRDNLAQIPDEVLVIDELAGLLAHFH